MIEIEQEVPDEWKTPVEGFNEDIEEDDDFETTRFGMHAIDRLISSIGEKELLPVLSVTVQALLENEDWRYKYAAIMALSQTGEYIEEISEITPIIQCILKFFGSDNAMIRYSVCHSIGQIADDMKPKFQEAFKGSIMP